MTRGLDAPKTRMSGPNSHRESGLLTLAEVAQRTQRPDSTVDDWIKRGLPSRKEGRNRVVRLDDLLVFLAHDDGLPQGSQRERLAKAQAEKVEMENEQRRGRMIDANIVEETLLGVGAYLAREHDALPGRVASEFAGINEPAVIRARLMEELRIVRDGLAQFSARTADTLEDLAQDSEDHQAAAEADG